MDFDNIIITVLQSIGALGIISWTIKSLVKSSIDKDFEKFKIQFSKLHQERAEVIREAYYKLTDFENSMETLVSPISLKDRNKGSN